MAVDGVVEIERHASRTVYRDVVYAAIRGFRPLLLDLTVPVSAGPVPVDGAGHGFPGINLGALLDRSADFLAHRLAAS
ncbi:MAG: hypothetical protein QOG57_1172 [Pseudonocardiales bacterium]|nr:hypothetical protein [Pseudonocardiales bacterium]